MSKKNMFTPEEFLQERNINSYYEQDMIKRRAAEYLDIIIKNRHFLQELQSSCSHPNTKMHMGTENCTDCLKSWEI